MASNVRESRLQIVREIEGKIARDAEIRAKGHEAAEEILQELKEESPVDFGVYRAAWHLEDRPDLRRMPRWAAVNDDPKANLIEFGTGPDAPGGHSPYGPNTPTPEFAVAAKVAARHGGTAP